MNKPLNQVLSPDIEVLDWGRIDYKDAWIGQQATVRARINDTVSDRLILAEHPPVITLGRSGTSEDLRLSREALERNKVAVYEVERGGMATFHCPGQLTAYPIVRLKNNDLHLYLQTLLNAVASVLEDFGLNPLFKEGQPGIWVNSAKIASIGIAVKKWVTFHGVALNVNADLQGFGWITPCGQSDETVTSMNQELGQPLDMTETKERFVDAFCREFGYSSQGVNVRAKEKRPAWLTRKASCTSSVNQMVTKLRHSKLATVCEGAQCPNLGECFTRGTATFMILGDRCTRRCRFCAVDKAPPLEIDPDEPQRVAQMARDLKLGYVVVTSVTRDDLPDGGAGHFAETIEQIRKWCPETQVEVLIPDFKGNVRALQRVVDARPDMFNHNVETVPRLYSDVRPQARYRRSLDVLAYGVENGLPTKSGIMLGLGETAVEVENTLADLEKAGCRYLTLGQYLAPSKDHFPVARYLLPEEFEIWDETARTIGFKEVASAPFVRSSYRADRMAGG
ncbi:MAG: lipoyl synthase [Proteobacteria bacterium]|nr:lipoyl synthase [Pseudomonadota bacterium]